MPTDNAPGSPTDPPSGVPCAPVAHKLAAPVPAPVPTPPPAVTLSLPIPPVKPATAATIAFVGNDDTAGGRSPSSAPPPSSAGGAVDANRYKKLRVLGTGGFGEVRLVLDRKLDRTVAMKLLLPDLSATPAVRARFLAEIKVQAALQHPGIVTVHEFGELEDGRLWFTMPEVRGRTLRAVIEEAFEGAGSAGLPAHATRRLLDLFLRVCETLAYAHSKEIIHRDLKPDNIMVGEFGQVMVMDWGIARRIDANAPAAAADTPSRGAGKAAGPDALLTREGEVLGTPAYMAPEQARGEISRLGPPADVYALGTILYHMLTGRPPFVGVGAAVKPEVVARALEHLAGAPPELAAICARAMAFDAQDRYVNAGELAAEITVFLDGARRREQALAELQKAMAERHGIALLRAEVERLRDEAKRALAPIRPSDPMEAKLPGWTLEDEAERLERDVALRETTWLQAVQGALVMDPTLAEAHAALADHYKEKLTDAERSHRHTDAAAFELRLRAHARGRYADFLRGEGALTLVTDPPGARVTLYRHVARERRLHRELVRDLGRTPLTAIQLPRGSYLLSIQAPGRAEVRYPVLIERGEHWDGRAPGELDPYPIVLPPEEELGPDDIYIPAGFSWTGGDPEASESLPRRKIWVEGYILRRYPLTNRELLEFLSDIAATGRSGETLGYPAGYPGPLESVRGHPAFELDGAGRIALKRDSTVAWRLEGPAPIDWHMASAYAIWLADSTGKPWRLPNELEREKAARGADGRLAPWGNHFDPAFTCVAEVHRGDAAPHPVGAHAADESPYGVRDLAGNMRDWCINIWKHEGPLIEGDRLRVGAAAADDTDFRAVRGGAWGSSIVYSRAAARYASRPGKCMLFVGARLARSYPAGGGAR